MDLFLKDRKVFIAEEHRKRKSLRYWLFRFRSILKNLSYRISGNIISKILALISLPIITRALGPENYGNFSLVTVIINYTAVLITFGIVPFGIREVASGKNPFGVIRQLLSARIIFAAVSILVSALTTWLIYKDDGEFYLVILVSYIAVVAQAFNIDYYFYGSRNMLVPTIAQLSGQVIYVMGAILFIRKPEHLGLLVFFYSLYMLADALVGQISFLALHKRLPEIRLSVQNAIFTLKTTFRLGIASKLELLMTSFPIIIISVMLGSYQLGLFSAAFRFFSILLILYQAIMLTMAPYIVKLKDAGINKKIRYIQLLVAGVFFLGAFMGLFFFGMGEWTVNILFGKSFGESTPILKLICLLMIPFWPVNMALGSVLLYFGYEKKYLYANFFAGGFILLFTPLLITFFSLKGSVIAIGISNLASIIVNMIYINQLLNGRFIKIRIKTR
ncbi:MAG: oligosaccharide flippase family protein [Bacteroidales bacterium]|nr:oligosaccharide flippase family protein [Bacteroidales bacterium]